MLGSMPFLIVEEGAQESQTAVKGIPQRMLARIVVPLFVLRRGTLSVERMEFAVLPAELLAEEDHGPAQPRTYFKDLPGCFDLRQQRTQALILAPARAVLFFFPDPTLFLILTELEPGRDQLDRSHQFGRQRRSVKHGLHVRQSGVKCFFGDRSFEP